MTDHTILIANATSDMILQMQRTCAYNHDVVKYNHTLKLIMQPNEKIGKLTGYMLVFDETKNQHGVCGSRIGNDSVPSQFNYAKPFLAQPCTNRPTYANNIVCNNKECCTKQHQLFDNMTKSK